MLIITLADSGQGIQEDEIMSKMFRVVALRRQTYIYDTEAESEEAACKSIADAIEILSASEYVIPASEGFPAMTMDDIQNALFNAADCIDSEHDNFKGIYEYIKSLQAKEPHT